MLNKNWGGFIGDIIPSVSLLQEVALIEEYLRMQFFSLNIRYIHYDLKTTNNYTTSVTKRKKYFHNCLTCPELYGNCVLNFAEKRRKRSAEEKLLLMKRF